MPKPKRETGQSVWRALSDETRRSLLDLLRNQPRTTGQLCEPFGVSRFAIMKHLRVLESAGLITVKRVGRERWNYLNAVPIRQLYDRWVSGFASHWAESLVGLKTLAERPAAIPAGWTGASPATEPSRKTSVRQATEPGSVAADLERASARESPSQAPTESVLGTSSVTPPQPGLGNKGLHMSEAGKQASESESASQQADSFVLHQEVFIEAPRAKVFDALLNDVNQWWAHRFQAGKSTVKLEPTVGGRFYEDFGNGEGAIFGTLTYMQRPGTLRFSGPLGMNTAVSGCYVYELADQGQGTLLKVTHQAIGFIDPTWREGYSAGWNELLAKYLKTWVEQRKPWTELPKLST